MQRPNRTHQSKARALLDRAAPLLIAAALVALLLSASIVIPVGQATGPTATFTADAPRVKRGEVVRLDWQLFLGPEHDLSSPPSYSLSYLDPPYETICDLGLAEEFQQAGRRGHFRAKMLGSTTFELSIYSGGKTLLTRRVRVEVTDPGD